MEIEINEIKSHLKKGERLLGLDLGSKTIGLALSDIRLTIASPMETIKRKKFTQDAERLLTIIKEQNVGDLSLGFRKTWMDQRDQDVNQLGNSQKIWQRKLIFLSVFGMSVYLQLP